VWPKRLYDTSHFHTFWCSPVDSGVSVTFDLRLNLLLNRTHFHTFWLRTVDSGVRVIFSVWQKCYSVCDWNDRTTITFLHLLVFSGRFGCKRDFLPTTEFTTKQNTFSYLLIVYARFGGAHDFLCLYVTELLLCLWLNLLLKRTCSHTFWCCTVDSGVSVTFWPSLYDRNVTPSSFTCTCVCARVDVSVCLCVCVSVCMCVCVSMTF